MNEQLQKVFAEMAFTTEEGKTIKIHSETGEDQCRFLQQLIKDGRYTRSVEIGFAYGLSALAITEAIVANGGSHTVIDVFELSGWEGVGIKLLEKAGYRGKFEFHEDYCYKVLPTLLAAGRKFDFAYIDSTKQFDWLLVDFFFIDKMLEVNGMIVFDDVATPGIRKLLRYLAQFPNYKVVGAYPANRESTKRKILHSLSRIIPFRNRILKPEMLLTDLQLGIHTNCVALQKTEEDPRKWDWHKEF